MYWIISLVLHRTHAEGLESLAKSRGADPSYLPGKAGNCYKFAKVDNRVDTGGLIWLSKDLYGSLGQTDASRSYGTDHSNRKKSNDRNAIQISKPLPPPESSRSDMYISYKYSNLVLYLVLSPQWATSSPRASL